MRTAKDINATSPLKTVEAAQRLRVSPSTLTKWRMRGEGPPFIRCGSRLILYDPAAIDAWLETRRSDRGQE